MTAAMTQNTPRAYNVDITIDEYPLAAGAVVLEGQTIGDNGSGYARALVAGDKFLGFALEPQDNTNGAAGALTVQVRKEGAVQLSIGSLAITDKGKAVYASDDNTFTLTATSNSFVGRVSRFVSSGVGIVRFEPGSLGATTAFTDSTGGSISTTLAAIASGTPADLAAQGVLNGIIRNALASLAAAHNINNQMTK
jgi:hypothetical protein